MKWFLQRLEILQFNCTFRFYWKQKFPEPSVRMCMGGLHYTICCGRNSLWNNREMFIAPRSSSEQDHGEKKVVLHETCTVAYQNFIAPHNRVVPFVYNSFKKQKDCRSGCIAGHPFDAPAVENHAEKVSAPRSNELPRRKMYAPRLNNCAQ